jgi:eukaryotic-like serine/threonine-protein kinase
VKYNGQTLKFIRLTVMTIALGSLALGQRPEPQLHLALVDLSGKRQDVGMVPIYAFAPRISPDGRQFAFDTQESRQTVWIGELPTMKSLRRLPGVSRYPMWSADGERLFFVDLYNGHDALYWRRADGRGDRELLIETARAPEHLFKNSQAITFITLTTDYDVWRYSLVERKATPLVEQPGSSQHSSRVSPDDRWLAYVSDETGRFEVYVQPLPATGAKFQITREGGEHPIWSPDGAVLYFNRGGRLYSVPLRAGATISAGVPSALPIMGFVQGQARRQFDITPDGKQFLMLFPS